MISDLIFFVTLISIYLLVGELKKRTIYPQKYWINWSVWFVIYCFLGFLVTNILKSSFVPEGKLFKDLWMTLIVSGLIYCLGENIRLHLRYKQILSRIDVLNTAKSSVEMEVLRNQLDPHFIFNSLNTLAYLVENETQVASHYLENLSKVYRYILSDKENNLVSMTRELEFLDNYFQLIRIRHGEAIQISIRISNAEVDELFIPMMALQLLVENCIKHNTYSEEEPLIVKITITEDEVSVNNLIRPKYYNEPTSKTGLKNLDDRYLILLNKSIILENKNGSFNVRLPLKKNSYA